MKTKKWVFAAVILIAMMVTLDPVAALLRGVSSILSAGWSRFATFTAMIAFLILAYENPVSVRGIADTIGMPTAYIEPLIDKLVEGELMGRTEGGLVYTRCFIQRQSESFGDIPAQEALADKNAEVVVYDNGCWGEPTVTITPNMVFIESMED